MTISGWAFDPSVPTQPLAIRAYVGGGANGGGTPYELGPVAAQERSDVALAHSAAGPAHGFDATFPVAASGRQRVCVYALGVSEGSDRALGCRTVGIRVPISISAVKATRRALWIQLACEWPSGTPCPGPDPASRPRPPLQRGQAPRQAGAADEDDPGPARPPRLRARPGAPRTPSPST